MNSPVLHIVVYHYIRDLPQTRFPRIKGMLTSDFRQQVADLADSFEMATLDSALAFLTGEYRPASDLCLLTFDDGVKEHYTDAMPVLAERKIQGVFFLITGCLEDTQVAPVHMNHFLMASLPFAAYRSAFLEALDGEAVPVDPDTARHTYPWDALDIAEFKYLFNFVLDPARRDAVVRALFARYVGEEQRFSRELYLSWEEARAMQRAGMVLGGHTHEHRPLSKLSAPELVQDLSHCARLLDANLGARPIRPFCYPYGKRDSFSAPAIRVLKAMGFSCAFTTEAGPNLPGADLFEIGRVDCKNAPVIRSRAMAVAESPAIT